MVQTADKKQNMQERYNCNQCNIEIISVVGEMRLNQTRLNHGGLRKGSDVKYGVLPFGILNVGHLRLSESLIELTVCSTHH